MAAVQGLSFDPAMQKQQSAYSQPMQNTKPWEFDWTKPQGAELRQKAMEFGGINVEDVNKQAALAAQQQREKNVAAYNAAVASQRGTNPAQAVFGMGQNLANANAETAANAQNLQAQNTLAGDLANQQMALQYYGLQQQAGMGQAELAQQKELEKRRQNIGILGSLFGGAASVGAAAALHSDKNVKEPVNSKHHDMIRQHMGFKDQDERQMAEEGPERTEKFMDSLHPQSYQYKEGIGENPYTPHVGVMAQDLEKTPEGASAVSESPEGKVVDTSRLSMMLAAALGDVHKRLEALEGAKSGRRNRKSV